MGGRRPGDSKVIYGNSKAVAKNIGNLQTALQSGSNSKVVAMALGLLASSNPAIGNIIFATKVLKLAYNIYEKTQDEYEKTGDYTSAVAYAVTEIAGREINENKDITIDLGVKIIWNKIKEENNIVNTSNEADEIVISAVTDVIKENLHGFR